MKRILNTVLGLIPHVLIVLSVMMITFYITDRYNRPMAFINNDITKALLLVMSVLVIVQSVYLIYTLRKKKTEVHQRALEQERDKTE